MKSASDRTTIAPTAFGLLMDPACLRRAADDSHAVFANVTHEPTLDRHHWGRLWAHASRLGGWVFHRAAH